MKRSWYNNGNYEILLRDINNIPEGFISGRLNKETKFEKLSKAYPKEQIYNLYIIQNIAFHKLCEQLDISSSDLHTLLYNYKIKKDPTARAKNNNYKRSREEIEAVAKKSSETQKKAWQNKSDEERKAWSDMQKIAHNSAHFKQTISEINKQYRRDLKINHPDIEADRNKRRRASAKKAWENGSLLERRNATTERNRLAQKGKLCRTIAEQKLYDILKEKYSDLVYDKRIDDRYPYYCDFYIPSKDIFIELQAHPSHGRLPIEFLDIEEYSNYPEKWVDTFARRDVDKLNKAKESKIHLIRIYPQAKLEENLTINSGEDKDIVTICYNSQK